MKLRYALPAFLVGIVCMSLWRTRGNYFDRYWVNEYTGTRPYCTIVSFPKHPAMDRLRVEGFEAYRTTDLQNPLVAIEGFGARADGMLGDVIISAVLDPAKREFSPAAMSSRLELAGLEDLPGYTSRCECGDSTSTARCEDSNYRGTGPYGPQDCYLFASKSLEALYKARRNGPLTGWQNLGNPLDFIWFSHNGVFAFDFYRRGKPDQILTSLHGGWWGNSERQYDYAESHSLWISDRYFLVAAELSCRSFLLCDFGGL